MGMPLSSPDRLVSSFAAAPATPCRRPILPRRPALRITRVLDDTRQPGQAGRMVITGNMDAVCAELERLARLESH